jgi:hypothetical protein
MCYGQTWPTDYGDRAIQALRCAWHNGGAGWRKKTRRKMTINRREFLGSMAGGAAAWSTPKFALGLPSGDRLVLSAPLTHSDWMLKPGISAGQDGVKHMLDACRASGWSHVYWRAFDAGQSTYRSKLLAPASHAEEDNFHHPVATADRELVEKYSPGTTDERRAEILQKLNAVDYGQFDSLAAAVEYGHSIGLQIHAWATINEDDHGWGWRSEFSKSHPQFRWIRRDGREYRSQLSFAFAEVRQYKLDLIKELLAYDIDGLFLDWVRTGDVRDNPQTDADGVADSGYEAPNVEAFRAAHGVDPHTLPNGDDRWIATRAAPQTEFMRGVRKLTTARGKATPIAVMVGHPWHYRGLLDPIAGNVRGLLLDVATWASEGLMDAAIAAGYYRAGGSAEAAYRALEKETAGAVDLWYYAWVPQTPTEFAGQFTEARKLGAQRILFWEADYIDDRPQATALKAAMSARALF